MNNNGIVKSLTRIQDDDGVTILRVMVDFYDGNVPDINNGTIWLARPVTVTDASIVQQVKKT